MSPLPKPIRPDSDDIPEGVEDHPEALVPQEVDPTSTLRLVDPEEELDAICRAIPQPEAGPVSPQPAEVEQPPAIADFDPLAELNDLLKESLAEQDKAKGIKDQRRRLASVDTLSRAERLKLEEAVHRWEAENEWISIDVILVCEHQFCTHCKHTQEFTFGVYEHQRSRKKDGGFRWTKYWPGPQVDKLPRRVAVKFHEVQVCPHCANSQGFVEITELSW